MKTNKETQQIADALSICHDGSIIGILSEPPNLTLKIACLYLAEMIDPSFNCFHYRLVNCSVFELIDYDNNKYTDFIEIQKMEADIYEAEINEDESVLINVHFNRQNGGIVNIRAERIEIFNHKMEKMEFEELHSISRRYWKREDG
jgi:hypothetical protein